MNSRADTSADTVCVMIAIHPRRRRGEFWSQFVCRLEESVGIICLWVTVKAFIEIDSCRRDHDDAAFWYEHTLVPIILLCVVRTAGGETVLSSDVFALREKEETHAALMRRLS